MKINTIQINDFLGIHKFQAEIAQKNTIIYGPNASGKSSIQNAIRMALTGEPSRVKLKREYGNLVKEGEGTSIISLNNNQQVIIKKTGKSTGLPHPENISLELRVSLDAGYFTAMKNKERKQFLYEMLGAPLSVDQIIHELINRGLNNNKVKELGKYLITGFENACLEAKSKASESRGVWKSITNETYGSEKADHWQAKAPTHYDGRFIEIISKKYEKTKKLLDEMTLSLQKDASNEELNNRIKKMRSDYHKSNKRYLEDVELLKKTEEDLKKIVIVFNEANDRLESFPKNPTVPDYRCPECSADLDLINGALVKHEKKHVDLAEREKVQAEVDKTWKKVRSMSNQVKELKEKIAMANRDKAALESVEKKVTITRMDPIEKQELENRIVDDKSKLMTLEKQINDQRDAKRLLDEAIVRTKKAKEAHINVCEWVEIEKALSSEGFPYEILKKTIFKFNKALELHSSKSGWQQVRITPEMEVEYDERNYSFISESEKWRTDAIISAVLIQMSGTEMLMLDRVDVLDADKLVNLKKWCNYLSDLGIQVLLFGTLSEKTARKLELHSINLESSECQQ